jgi:hypothetical protein
MDHKEQTMAKIKELEDLLSNERISYENKVKDYRQEMDMERLK